MSRPIEKATTRRRTAPLRRSADFTMPRTISHPALLVKGSDLDFRQTVYLMVLAFGRLLACREAFGRALGLTGSQFAVLIGTAYQQGQDGVSIRALAQHIQLASTHVTTEVGRLIRLGLLTKRTNSRDRRGVLVRLSSKGEAALLDLAPFLRHINDILFRDISRTNFDAVSEVLTRFVVNSEQALAEIRRTDIERVTRPRPKTKNAQRAKHER
jgi:DNA-binding MarR family transcriptional regulator